MKIGYIIFICAIFVSFSNCDEELVSVITLFRHGDRTPIYAYPNDPYDASYWEIGYGQLTNEGKKTHFELGQWIRQRYEDFLPQKYNTVDIRVQSTDVDRTLMSAQVHLAGLYPPVEDLVWNDQLLWQPIPIHTSPEADDIVLAMTTNGCSKYQRLYAELEQSPDIQDLYQQNADLFQYLRENSGDNNINTFSALNYLFDTLFVEKENNLTLPDWTDDVYEQMRNLSVLGLSLGSWTPELAKLKAGRLVYDILHHFEDVSSNVPTQKFKIYSAHDSNVVYVLSAMSVFDGVLPSYTSTVIFELKKNETSTYVNLWYKNGGQDIHKLTLNGCDFNCELDDVKDILQDILIPSNNDWLNECNS